MKHIVSTLETQIVFPVTSSRILTIDPVTPVAVTELELALLQTRLGNQIRVVSGESTTTSAKAEDPKKEEAPVDTTTTDEALPDSGDADADNSNAGGEQQVA